MSFRVYVRRVEAKARHLGIRLSMSKLRDAISRSIYNRHYSAAVAADVDVRPKLTHLAG